MDLRRLLTIWVCIHFTMNARAIIFYSTGDPTYNTNAPTGALTNSGWQFQGQWGPYLGTAIAPRYFITAKHVQGAVGETFHLAGQDYTTLTAYENPNSDLRIWRVCGSFPAWANVYTNDNEVGLPLVVFGRGTQRGDPVVVNSMLRGWFWGLSDSVQRWGENVVSGVVDGGAGVGDLLAANFDANAGPNEAHLSVGDSGGGVFIQDAGQWKLAGINFSVDGPFSTNNTGPGFDAAIFDESGLYLDDNGVWELQTASVPSAFYATRISTNVAWIQSILAQTPPPDPPPVLQVSAIVTGPYADATGAAVHTSTMTITIARTAQNQFFRLRACSPNRLTGITTGAQLVTLTYE